jgi:hypothetical protein
LSLFHGKRKNSALARFCISKTKYDLFQEKTLALRKAFSDIVIQNRILARNGTKQENVFLLEFFFFLVYVLPKQAHF